MHHQHMLLVFTYFFHIGTIYESSWIIDKPSNIRCGATTLGLMTLSLKRAIMLSVVDSSLFLG